MPWFAMGTFIRLEVFCFQFDEAVPLREIFGKEASIML